MEERLVPVHGASIYKILSNLINTTTDDNHLPRLPSFDAYGSLRHGCSSAARQRIFMHMPVLLRDYILAVPDGDAILIDLINLHVTAVALGNWWSFTPSQVWITFKDLSIHSAIYVCSFHICRLLKLSGAFRASRQSQRKLYGAADTDLKPNCHMGCNHNASSMGAVGRYRNQGVWQQEQYIHGILIVRLTYILIFYLLFLLCFAAIVMLFRMFNYAFLFIFRKGISGCLIVALKNIGVF